MATAGNDRPRPGAGSSGDDLAWLAGFSPRLHAPLLRCARGEASANVVVMQLHAEGISETEAETVLQAAARACRGHRAAAAARLEAALALVRAHPGAFATVKAVLDGVEHGAAADGAEAGVARWAAVFDRAVRASPEGSVALYALGDPALLRAATIEIVDLLGNGGLLGSDRSVLDVGCGIGRLEAALAPEVARVVGIDISGAMIESARERCADRANASFVQSSGRDLSLFADASFDLVVAVDSFPYLVQSGLALAATHVREAARVLRPRGDLMIFNFSYRGDADADRADVAGMAAEAGFHVVRDGTREFSLWDGLTFHLAREGP